MLFKQFPNGKRDQRQFIQGRAVIFRQGPQNCEVDQIHIGVRFQQVAPGPLAHVRLPRNQQHPQAIPDGVDADQRVIVGGGNLTVYVSHSDFKNVSARVLQRCHDFQSFVGSHCELLNSASVRAQAGRDGRARLEGCIFGSQAQGDGFIDQAKFRRFDHHNAAIPLVLTSGQQHMHRRFDARLFGQGRHIVNNAVGDQNNACQTTVGNVCDGSGNRIEQACAVTF